MDWIKFDNGIPDNGQEILLTDMEYVYTASYYYHGTDIYCNRIGCYEDKIEKSVFVYWMPIPKIPEK